MILYVISTMGYNPNGEYPKHHADFYIAQDIGEALDAAKMRFLQMHPDHISLSMSHYELESGVSVQGVDGKFYTLQFKERN